MRLSCIDDSSAIFPSGVLKAHEISDEEFATYIEVISEKGAAGNFSSFPAMKWVDIDVKLPKLVSANGVCYATVQLIDPSISLALLWLI